MYTTGTADTITISQYESTLCYTFYNGSNIATDVTNVKTEPAAVENVEDGQKSKVEGKKYLRNGPTLPPP